MTTKPKTKPDDPKQSKRFEETARLLETDESGKAFKSLIKKLIPEKNVTSKKI